MQFKTNVEIPALQRGYELISEKGLVIVAMSIGNGYFNKENIDLLLPFVNDHFSQSEILIADIPSIHTYRALGYDQKAAEKKTRLAGNRLRNHCNRTTEDMSPPVNIAFVDWEEQVVKNPEYQKQLKYILKLYDSHHEFQHHVRYETRLRHAEGLNCFWEDARETTEGVLKGKIKEGIDLDKAIDLGVNYLLEELAFLLASPAIFGVEKTAYLYHREWPIYVNLIDGKYDDKVRTELSYIQTE